jgi:TetR/AcrR family transcriptional repressor of nem operon
MSKIIKKKTKREDILAKAASLILEKGYEDFSMHDLEEKSNCARGCIYYHFKSKKEITEKVIDEIIKIKFADSWKDVYKGDNPVESICGMLDGLLLKQGNALAKKGCPLGNIAMELSHKDKFFSKKIQSIVALQISHIEKALTAAKSKGIIRKNVETDATAKFIVSLIEGCIMTAKTFQDKTILENCFKLIKDYLRNLYACEK